MQRDVGWVQNIQVFVMILLRNVSNSPMPPDRNAPKRQANAEKPKELLIRPGHPRPQYVGQKYVFLQ
jgi:hypothetical protein